MTLTSEQQCIVDVGLDGPWLVDAGAGTGKTFTLVERARALIERGVLRPDELLVVTFTHAAANEIAERLDRVLPRDGRARPTCGTFHGIAGSLLREFAYETGTSPELRQIDDGRARGVFHRAFEDLIAGRLDVDLSAFPLLERMPVLERSLASMAIRLKNDGMTVAAACARAREATTKLETIGFGQINRRLNRGGFANSKEFPVPKPAREQRERHAEAHRERANVDVVEALFSRFDELLAADDLVLYGDVMRRAERMVLDQPRIAARLRARWKHAIVDEFQDTSDGQLAFLKAVFGEKLEPLLAVGDVRQAIFEFSGARPQNIVDFRQLARKSLPLMLNRRSLKPILDVAHFALNHLEGVAKNLNPALTAHRGAADPTCVRLSVYENENALEEEAAAVAGTIATLVADGVPPNRCAVLLRASTRAGVFARALLERGIAVQLFGGAGFFTAPEIREVVAWIRFAFDPTDAFAVTAILQNAAIGSSDGAIAHLARERRLAEAALFDALPEDWPDAERARIERFRRIAAIVGRLANAPLVEAVQAVVRAAGADVARIAEPGSAAQVRANLDKFVAFTIDFAKDRKRATIADLVAELDEREAYDLDLPIAEIEGDRVAIMTIHKAKGLEWDHVFVADVKTGIFPSTRRGNDDVAVFDPITGALALKHGIDGRPTLRWWLTKHEHDVDGHLVEREATPLDEEFRLLYVALTRARDRLYITGRLGGSRRSKCIQAVDAWIAATGAASGSHELAVKSLAASEAIPANGRQPTAAVTSTAIAQLELDVYARLERERRPDVAPALRRGPLSYTAIETYERCPRRAHYRYVLGLPEFPDDAGGTSELVRSDASAHRDTTLHDVADGDDAATLEREKRDPARDGRVIHRVLEWTERARVVVPTSATMATAASRSRAATMETTATHSSATVAGEVLQQRPIAELLDAALDEEGWSCDATDRQRIERSIEAARTALETFAPLATEQRFDVALDDVALGGYIDLIARDADGAVVLVDYKTGGTQADRYGLQFALYAYAVRDTYPDVATLVLRITDMGATFEPIVPASFEHLRASVVLANVMADEPRPGTQCAYCPYADNPCDAAPQLVAHSAADAGFAS